MARQPRRQRPLRGLSLLLCLLALSSGARAQGEATNAFCAVQPELGRRCQHLPLHTAPGWFSRRR